MNTIIHVSGRLGSTLSNKIFSYYPEFTWISFGLNKHLNQACLSKFNATNQDQ
jgi:hypothetical protein